MTTPKALKTLIKLKERRVKALDDAVKQARAARQEAQDQLARSEEEHATKQAAEAAARAAVIDRLSNPVGFQPNLVITLNYIVGDRERDTAAAAQAVEQQRQQVQAAEQAVAQAQRALQRGEKQVETAKEKLAKVVAELSQAADDTQDEESEEASVARMLAATRAEKQAAAA